MKKKLNFNRTVSIASVSILAICLLACSVTALKNPQLFSANAEQSALNSPTDVASDNYENQESDIMLTAEAEPYADENDVPVECTRRYNGRYAVAPKCVTWETWRINDGYEDYETQVVSKIPGQISSRETHRKAYKYSDESVACFWVYGDYLMYKTSYYNLSWASDMYSLSSAIAYNENGESLGEFSYNYNPGDGWTEARWNGEKPAKVVVNIPCFPYKVNDVRLYSNVDIELQSADKNNIWNDMYAVRESISGNIKNLVAGNAGVQTLSLDAPDAPETSSTWFYAAYGAEYIWNTDKQVTVTVWERSGDTLTKDITADVVSKTESGYKFTLPDTPISIKVLETIIDDAVPFEMTRMLYGKSTAIPADSKVGLTEYKTTISSIDANGSSIEDFSSEFPYTVSEGSGYLSNASNVVVGAGERRWYDGNSYAPDGRITSIVSIFNDDSTYNWGSYNSGYSSEYPYHYNYMWQWRGNNPEKLIINAPILINWPMAVTLKRNAVDLGIKLESVDPQNHWDNIYTTPGLDIGTDHLENLKQGMSETEFAADGLDITKTYAVSNYGRFYLSVTGKTEALIKVFNTDTGQDVTDEVMTYDESAGKYKIYMPSYKITISATAKPDLHRFKLVANTPDYSLNSVTVCDGDADNLTADNMHLFRYKDADEAELYTDNTVYTRSSEVLEEIGYFTGNENWRLGFKFNGAIDREGYYELTDIHVYEMNADGSQGRLIADPVAEFGLRTGMDGNMPYIKLNPAERDFVVTCDFKLIKNIPKIYGSIKVPEKGRYAVFYNEFTGQKYNEGTESQTASFESNTLNRAQFINSNLAGAYLAGEEISYSFRGDYRADDAHAFMTFYSWHVYKADGNGKPIGDPIETELGLPEIKYTDITKYSSEPSYATNEKFVMPEYDIVFCIEYGPSIPPVTINQYIVDANGNNIPAGDDISVTLKGKTSETDYAFLNGTTLDSEYSNEVTISGASGTFGLISIFNWNNGAQPVCIPNPSEEYYPIRVYYAGHAFGGATGQYAVAQSDGSFLINDNNLFYGYSRAIVIDVYYIKMNTVTLTQSTDGIVLEGNKTVFGQVELWSDDGSSYVDPSSNSLNWAAYCPLAEKTKTDKVKVSLGAKMKITVRALDSSRVISSFSVYKMVDGEKIPIDYTVNLSSYSLAAYALNEAINEGDDIHIDVSYATADRLTVQILMKDSGNNNDLLANTDDNVYAVIKSTGGSITEKAFKPFSGSDEYTDEFEVRKNAEAYTTVGNTGLDITVHNVPDGYIVANVDVKQMNNGGYAEGTSLAGVTPNTENDSDYGECRDFTHCTYIMPGGNVYIRIILAKTARVTVNFKSRGDNNNDLFVNEVEDSYITFTHSNSAYGDYSYPIVIDNNGKTFNVSAYTVTNNPSTRTVLALDRTNMSGKISVKRGYLIASVFTTRTKDGVTENVGYEINRYSFGEDAGTSVFQAQFNLSQSIECGYDYDVTVNIEKAASIRFNSYHSSSNGGFVSNYWVSDCTAVLYGKRGSADAEAPYNNLAYQSDAPFSTGRNEHDHANNMIGALTTNYSVASYDYYVLRNTDLTLTAQPIKDEIVYKIDVYDADDKSIKYPYTLVSTDEDGTQHYTIDAKTSMTNSIVVDVYFSSDLSGDITIINQDVDGNPITLDEGSSVYLRAGNSSYNAPIYDDSGNSFSGVNCLDSKSHYKVMSNTYGSLQISPSNGYMLVSTYIKYKDADDLVPQYFEHYSAYYTFGTNDFTSDNKITIVNVFRKSAMLDITQYVEADAKDEWRVETGGYIVSSNNIYDSQGNVVYSNVLNSNVSNYAKFAVGGQLDLSVEPKKGYTLKKIKIVQDGGSGYSKTLLPDDFTVNSNGVMTYKFDDLIWEQMTSGGYHIHAYFTATYIYVTQMWCYESEWNDDDYTLSNLHYDSAGRVTTDASQDFVIYAQGRIGVKNGTDVVLAISPHIDSRVGKVLYGESSSTQSETAFTPNAPGLGEIAYVSIDNITSARYLTVIYIVEDPIEPSPPIPPQPVSTEISNSLLTVNSYEYDESSGRFVLSNANDVSISLNQLCIGYDDGQEVSTNRRHGKNYNHDTEPSLYIYNPSDESFSPLIGALAKDELRDEAWLDSGPVKVEKSSSVFAVKVNSIDNVRVNLTATARENYRLEKMVVINNTRGTSSVISANRYEYYTSNDSVTINLYFSRPIVEVGTNNTAVEHKGAVSVDNGTENIVVAENDTYMQAARFNSHESLKLTVKPEEGYKFSGIMAGDTRNAMTYIGSDKIIENQDGTITVNLGEKTSDVYIQVQFAEINQTPISTLIVRQYMLDESGNAEPTDAGTVIISGTHSSISSPIIFNREFTSRITLKNQSMISTGIYEGTSVSLTVSPPASYKLFGENAVTAIYYDENYNKHQINVSSTLDKIFELEETVPTSSTVYIDVYYTKGYSVTYYGNGSTGGRVPEDDTVYFEGDIAQVKENEGNLTRRNYTFEGWSRTPGENNESDKVGDTVTFSNGDVSLYAVWKEAAKFTVTYDGNGNTGGTPPTDSNAPYYVGSEVTVLGKGDLTKTDHTFLGWSEDKSSTEALFKEGDKFKLTKDTTLYAVWHENDAFNLTYRDSLDDSFSRTENYHEGNITKVKSAEDLNLSHEGYSFDKWTVEPSEGYSTEVGDMITVNGNVTYTAQWNPNNYKVLYYQSDGTTQIASDGHAYKSSVTVGEDSSGKAVSAPEVTGYLFKGWTLTEDSPKRTDADGNEIPNNGTFTMPSGTVKFKAVYDEKLYSVEYQPGEAGIAAKNMPFPLIVEGMNYTSVKDGYKLAAAPSAVGYTFEGWKVNGAAVNNNAETNIEFSCFDNNDKKAVAVAQWSRNSYAVRYYDINGNELADLKDVHKYLDEVNVRSVSEIPSINGKTVSAWILKESSPMKVDANGADIGVGGKFAMPAGDVEFTASYTDNKYTVTYKANYSGNTQPDVVEGNISYEGKHSVKNHDIFTRAGWHITGWQVEPMGYSVTPNEEITVTENVIYKALWAKNTYTVTYQSGYDNSGQSDKVYSAEYGDSHTVPPYSVFTRAGWHITGWRLVSPRGNNYPESPAPNDSFTIADNVIYEAVWEENQHQVIYNVSVPSDVNYTKPSDSTKKFGANVAVELVPSGFNTKKYTFVGWSTEDVEITEGKFTMPDKDVVFTGVFTVNGQITLNYNANGGEGDVPDSVSDYTEVFETMKDKGNLTKVGHRFDNWNENVDGTGKVYNVGTEYTFRQNTTVYAKWIPNNYDVKYYDIKGNEIVSYGKSPLYGSDVTIRGKSEIPAVVGKSPTGWVLMNDSIKNDANGNPIVPAEGTFQMPAGTVKLQAVYTDIEYRVEYVINGTIPENCTVPSDENTYLLNDEVNVKENPTGYNAKRYSFGGWTTIEASVSDGKFKMPDVADRIVTFTGVFTENDKVTLTYAPNGGTPMDAVPPQESDYPEFTASVKAPANNFAKTGYIFVGWNTKADGSGTKYEAGSSIKVSENTVLYAQWAKASFNVEYYDIDGFSINGKSPIVVQSYEYEENVQVGRNVSAPSIDGKEFVGWTLIDSAQKDSNGAEIGVRSAFPMPAETVRFKAVYKSLTYRVTYRFINSGPDGITPPVDNNEYSWNSEVIVALPTEAPDGYTFKGWMLNGKITDKFNITEDSELTGEWTKIDIPIPEVTVTYISGVNGAAATDPSLGKVKLEKTASDSNYTVHSNQGWTDYIRPGYRFVNWKVVAPKVTGLSFVDNIFARFTSADDILGRYFDEGDTIEDLSGNITLEAQWEELTYRVYYDGNGATGGEAPIDETAYRLNDKAVLKENTFIKDNFTFSHWNTEPDDSGTSYVAGGEVTVLRDTTLYAVWTTHPNPDPDPVPKAYIVHYDGNGADKGTPPTDREYNSGVTVTVDDRNNLEKTGFTFKEWNTRPDGKGTSYRLNDTFVMPENNVNLYAVWIDKNGNISSPGTGENARTIWFACGAMLISLIAGISVIVFKKKRMAE